MKITVIHGQDHKGSTYNIAKLLMQEISCEKEINEFFLPRDLNHFCAGCYACIKDETKCPYYLEKNIIMQKIESSDLLIFTTPNYCMAPTAPMKAFMDLTFTYWFSHKPRACMLGKKAIVISSTAGAGAKQAIKPVKRMLLYWGVPWIRSYAVSVQAMGWDGVAQKKKDRIAGDMKALAKGLSKEKKPYVPLKTKLMFTMFANMQKAGFGCGAEEKKYWEDKGWLGKERPWKNK